MFAGSCIAVILLVMSLGLLGRLAREYDRYILRQALSNNYTLPPDYYSEVTPSFDAKEGSMVKGKAGSVENGKGLKRMFRPSFLQQTIRAGLQMLVFTVACFVILLALSYNGYIFICISIGAFLGAFVFSWEGMSHSPEEGH
jgi:copper transporter 1